MSQKPSRVIVVRVRGLPQEHSTARALLKAAIDDPAENYKATIVPSCDRPNESVALVEFQQKLPATLAPLESDRLTPWQISVDNEDLSFDQNFLGFTQLYPTKEPVQADIVAICGVDGHAYGSWQGRGPLRRMWLRHFLSKDLPSCRTMIYGYKAKLSSKDYATPEDYAEDFLEALVRIWQKVPATRPIIFIAHSFGGLVIARAMIKLKQALATDEVALASIHRSICGLLFFAVPFRGIDVEDMSRIMDEQNHPRASLLKHITIGSADLKKQLQDFIDVLYGLEVVSFFETEQSRRLVRNESGEWQRSGEFFTTLEAENAVLNLPKEIETRVALHSDHSGIVKFNDKYDAGYEYAIDFLQRVLKNVDTGNLQRHELQSRVKASRRAYGSQGLIKNHAFSQHTSSFSSSAGQTPSTWQFAAIDKAVDEVAHASDDYHRAHIQPLRTQSRSKKDNDCLAKLEATDPRLDKRRIQATKGGLLKDSYSWIIENDRYKTWQNAQSNDLLWIRGDPGKGKTMLLCGIVDELGKTPSLAYFFCQATDNRINTATSVLRGLIYMLADQNPSTISHLRRKLEGGTILEGTNAWWALCDILENMLKELKDTCLIVDALDECGTGREELIEFVLQTSSSIEYRAKWIVSSRNWPDIKSSLHGVSSLSLELNAESVSSAVVSYIHYKISNLALKKSYDDNTQNHILDYLLTNAKGTFLWVALVCTGLERAKSWNARQTIVMFPPDLEQVYERMIYYICQSDDSEYHQNVLATVANLFRPVSPAELQTLVDLPTELTGNTATFMDFIDDCGSFLTIQDNRIEFVHQSAKDYIDRYFRKQEPSGVLNLHLSILDKSICKMSQFLKQDNYELKDCSLDISLIKLPYIDHLEGIRYACLYWFQHLKALDLEPTNFHLNDLLCTFVKDKFLPWLEAVSLFESVWYAISILYDFQIYLESFPEFYTLQSLAQDSYLFARSFREGIIHNPLQIYVSGMLFCPKQSTHKELLLYQSPSWLELKLQEDENWSSFTTTIGGDARLADMIVYSCDSKRIATKRNGTNNLWPDEIHVWDSVSGAEVSRLAIPLGEESNMPGLPRTVHTNIDVTFAPGNNEVHYISQEGRLRSWNLQTGETLQLTDLDFSMHIRVLSSDGRHVAFIKDGQVILYRIGLGISSLQPKEQSNLFVILAFSSNGIGLCAGTSEGRVVVWNVQNGKVVGSLDVARGTFRRVALANSLKYVAAIMTDGTLTISTIESGSKLWSRRHSKEIAFSYDSKTLARSDESALEIHDASDGSLLGSLDSGEDAIAFSPDCRQLAHGVELVDLRKADRFTRAARQVDLKMVYFSHGSSHLPVQRGPVYELWDLDHGSLTWQRTGDMASGGAGNRIVATTPDLSRPVVWHLGEDSIEQVDTIPNFVTSIQSISLAPDDARALVSTSEPQLFMWDLTTNVVKLLNISDTVRFNSSERNISWSKSTLRVAFSIPDGTVLVVDLHSADVLLRSPSVKGAADWKGYEICLSSSGRKLARLDTSSSVAVWDVDLGVLVSSINTEVAASYFPGAAFISVSEDDQQLSIVHAHSAKLFDIATRSLLRSIKIPMLHGLSSFSWDKINATVATSDGLLVVKDDYEVIKGTDDCLFKDGRWFYQNNKKLLWIPPQFHLKYISGGKRRYVLQNEKGGLLVFETRFGSTDATEI